MKKLLLILCMVLPLSLQAAQIQNLYQVEVQVDGQTNGERIKAMSIAIKEVFVRISGSKLIADSPELSAAIASPGRYVEGYRYERRQQGGTEFDFLLLDFSAEALQNLLVKKQLPLWPIQRSDVLVWLAVEGRSRPFIVKDTPLNIVNQAINDAAMSRGLPLSWPLDTDVEIGKVSVSDVKAGFVKEVVAASKDYSAQAILIGHVKRLSGAAWVGKWQLVRKEQTVSWDGDATDLQTAMSIGIDKVADTLAADFSISSTGDKSLLLVKVRGINDLEGYATTRAYLEGLLITQDVAVVKVYKNSVEYQLRLRGPADELLRAINLGGSMRVVPKVVRIDSIDSLQSVDTTAPSGPDYLLELIP